MYNAKRHMWGLTLKQVYTHFFKKKKTIQIFFKWFHIAAKIYIDITYIPKALLFTTGNISRDSNFSVHLMLQILTEVPTPNPG